MKFSVIVPVYNGEKYLLECIDSILRRIYRDFELAIAVDGSTHCSASDLRRLCKKRWRKTIVGQDCSGYGYENDFIRKTDGDL